MTPPTLPVPDELKEPDSQENWDAVVKWAGEEGTANLTDRQATLTNLRKEASTTLTVVLAGLGGTLAYAAKLFEPPAAGPVAFGAGVLCLYFVFLALYLVTTCMLVEDIPAVHNEPKNLALEGYELAAIRRSEVRKNLQQRIDEMRSVNDRIAEALNWARKAAAVSPIVFVLATIVYKPTSPAPPSGAIKLQCKAAPQAAASEAQLGCAIIP